MTVPASGFMMENGGSSCLPLPPDVENRIVTELGKESESNLKEGNLYYVVSNRYLLLLGFMSCNLLAGAGDII